MNRRVETDPELDVSEFIREFQGSNHPYGWVYNTEISEDLYKTYTYHSIWTFAAPNLTFRMRETQERLPESFKATGNHKTRGAIVTSSPYDFHGLVEPAIDWELINTIEGPILNDASYTDKIVEEDICFTGKAKIFDNKLLSTRPTKKRALPAAVAKEEPSLLTDPVIVDILKEKAQGAVRIVITAKCLAAVSVCNRSVCPFELVFEKVGDNVFVYPRTENSPAVMESTYETVTIPASLRREDIGSEFINSLQESSNIAAQFIAAANAGETQEFQLGDDIKYDGVEGSKSYVYRRFVLNNVEFIVRCEIDCLRDPVVEDERPAIAICRTFNDLPTSLRRSDWDTELEKQRSSLLLSEVKDNSNLFAKWTAIGRLMDCAQIFIGFAQRKVKSNTANHVLLAAQRQAYGRTASVISLTEKSMMGMMYLIFSKVIGQKDGIYHFQRDPKKRNVKIYKENK